MKKYQYVLKEPYDPKWLENLKNTELVEYKFYERTQKFSKRKRNSEDNIWSEWSQCCKHGKDLKNCSKCRIKVEKIYLRNEIDPNASYGEKQKQRVLIYRSYGKNMVEKNQSEKRKKRKLYLSSLNYKDSRLCTGIYCSKCHKKKISIEDYDKDFILPENCVYALSQIIKKEKRIRWHEICVDCTKNKNNDNYINGGFSFIRTITVTIRLHLDNSNEEAKIIYKNLCVQDDNRCYTCNTELIKMGKSGYRQLSINKLHPNLKESDILHLSCLACNLCQNSLPYFEFLKYILLIIENNNIRNDDDKELTKNELLWLKKQRIICPYDVRLHVVEKYCRSCIYTGLEIVYESHKFNTASFDRIDSKLPYTNDQVQLVCKHINYVKKGAIDESELFKWIENLKRNKSFIQKRHYHHELLNKWNSLF